MAMILVTGGTGFIGQALIRQLLASGLQVRTLIRPSQTSPRLPRGVSVDVVVSSLSDEKGVRAAMRDVDVVYHLVSGQAHAGVNLTDSDVHTTDVITRAAHEAGLDRLIYVSHIGADRSSAYPVMKAKGQAESIIRSSGLNYTIFRSSIVFGPGDHFTENLKVLIQNYPFFFFLPDQGHTLLQPLWVEDLVTCMVWALEDSKTRNKIMDIGGGETLSFRQVGQVMKQKLGAHNFFISLQSSYLRWVTLTVANNRKNFPLTSFWIDYLAEDHICPLDSLPRQFGILPARFRQKLDYLKPIPQPNR
jgi:uncharacterized protein YbjT (DUF2867 family)